MAYAVLAVTIGVVLQGIALNFQPMGGFESKQAKPLIESAAPSSSPVAAESPGDIPPPSPGSRMPKGELDTLPAEGAGAQPMFTPPPTAPAPATIEAVVTAATARVNAEGGILSRDEAIAVLRASGWPESAIPAALTVAHCESRWSPYATNGGNEGLFQINVTSGATLRGSWFAHFDEPDNPESWYDPLLNATVARWIWERSGWEPWSCKP